MTISDKIRIYELSRDLNLDNKDIIDAAQKLSISVRSHSSSISLVDAKKIKNLISKKNSVENIISVNKSSFKEKVDQPKINNESLKIDNKLNDKNIDNEKINKASFKKPLLTKPINKSENSKISSINTVRNNINVPNKPTIISKDNYKNPSNQVKSKFKGNSSTTLKEDKKTFVNPKTNNIKGPKRPSLQLIEKPKNLTNTFKGNNFNNKNNFLDKKPQQDRYDKNSNQSTGKNRGNALNKSTPELVGAPIRRADPKKKCK